MRAAVPDRLSDMLTRLKLTAVRDQLDGLLDEAGRQELSLRETLVLLCEREIARKDERRIEMTLKLARFPFVRDLSGFDFSAQPSLDRTSFFRIDKAMSSLLFVASAGRFTGYDPG